MEEVKALLVGESPYSNKEKYGPLKIKNYPTKHVAFFPEVKKDDFILYELTTYRRIIGFLNFCALPKDEFNKLDTPENLAKCYAKKGIYFINQNEIEIKNKKIYAKKFAFNKLIPITENTIIICFGNEAVKKFKKFESIYKYPHPSPQVTHKFWEQFDYKYKNYDEPIDLMTTLFN